MSREYYFDLFYKKEGQKIMHLNPVPGTFPKVLISAYGLYDSIIQDPVSCEYDEIRDKSLIFTHHVYLGKYPEDVISKLTYTPAKEDEEELFPGPQDKRVIVNSMEGLKDIPEDPRGWGVVLSTQYRRDKGWWLNSKSLDPFIERVYSGLKLIMDRTCKWEELSNSLEYLKLDDEARERVDANYGVEDLIEEPDTVDRACDNNYQLYILTEALKLKGAMEAFEDFETEVKMFVYEVGDATAITA